MLPRGIRNNNPLNIRRTAKDQWKGLRAQQTDASFCQFESLEFGWRAADQPERWIAVGEAMAIQENGIESLDHFAMLRGWGLAREGTSTLQP